MSAAPKYVTSLVVLIFRISACLLMLFCSRVSMVGVQAADSRESHRSPVDVVLSLDGSWLVTANQTSDSVSLVSVKSGRVLDEVGVGQHPSDVALTPDGQMVLVSAAWSGELTVLHVDGSKLTVAGSIHLGFEPCGIAIAKDGRRAWVGLVSTGEVAEVDLVAKSVKRKIAVGHWPRYLTLNPDNTRLSVGCAGDGEIVVVDTAKGEVLYGEALSGGINLGHMQTSDDGEYAYFPWMIYRNNPIDVSNIRRGWVLASRIGRVRLDGPSYREAISLDVPGKAIADPHGLAITADQKRLVVSASGTHELLVYRLQDLPFVSTGGPGDLIDQRLLADRDLFYRIETGGRPMGLQIAADHRTVFVANYLDDSVQEVDLVSREVTREFHVGGPKEKSLARRGMEIFYDGRRSLDQWYSCATCHQDGGINSRPMDTWNDGTALTPKMVLPLHNLPRTGPWTWHGWQTDLKAAMHKSLKDTMIGPPPSPGDAEAMIAFFGELQPPPNPFRNEDGSLSVAAERGRRVFESRKAACVHCHTGAFFTDGRIHDVGLGSDEDVYQGYNTPSLVGVYRKVRYLHNGRARTQERVLTDLHAPEKVAGEAPLTEQEVADLIAYLKSL